MLFCCFFTIWWDEPNQRLLREAAMVLEIIQGKTTVAEVSRSFDLPPSTIEEWMDEGKRGVENALRSRPLEVREEYERPLRERQRNFGEAMLELRARKKLQSKAPAVKGS